MQDSRKLARKQAATVAAKLNHLQINKSPRPARARLSPSKRMFSMSGSKRAPIEDDKTKQMKARLKDLDAETARRKKLEADLEEEKNDERFFGSDPDEPEEDSQPTSSRQKQQLQEAGGSKGLQGSLPIRNWSAILMSRDSQSEAIVDVDTAYLKEVAALLQKSNDPQSLDDDDKIEATLLFDQISTLLRMMGGTREQLATAVEISEFILAQLEIQKLQVGDLSSLQPLAFQVLELRMKTIILDELDRTHKVDEEQQSVLGEEDKSALISRLFLVFTDLLQQWTQSLDHLEASVQSQTLSKRFEREIEGYHGPRSRKKGLNLQRCEIPQAQLFHMTHSNISIFTKQICSLLQSAAFIFYTNLDQSEAFHFKEEQSGESLALEVVARLANEIVVFLFDKWQDSSGILEEGAQVCPELKPTYFLILETIAKDLFGMLTQGGIPLELPVALTLTKAICLNLIQAVNLHIIDGDSDSKGSRTSEDKQGLSLPSKQAIVDLVKHALVSFESLALDFEADHEEKVRPCYCGWKAKESDSMIESCSKCGLSVHSRCIGNWDRCCLYCELDQAKNQTQRGKLVQESLTILLQFYSEFSGGDFQDFSCSELMTRLKLVDLESKMKEKGSKAKSDLRKFVSDLKISKAVTRKSVKASQVNPQFAKAFTTGVASLVVVDELQSILKNLLLCISYSKQATLRQQSLKTLKQLIKIRPTLLITDLHFHKIIALRTTDISSITRESALDIVHKNLSFLVEICERDQLKKEVDCLKSYVDLVLQLSLSETNMTVTKKIVSILSLILDTTSEEGVVQIDLKKQIIQTLIYKLGEEEAANQSTAVYSSLVASVERIIKQAFSSGRNADESFSILFSIAKQQLADTLQCPPKSKSQQVFTSESIVGQFLSKDDKLLHSIFSEVLQGGSKKTGLFKTHGEDLFKATVRLAYLALDDSKSQKEACLDLLSSLHILEVLSELSPQLLRDGIKYIVALLGKVKDNESFDEIEILIGKLFSLIFTNLFNSLDEGEEESQLDWLSASQTKIIEEFALSMLHDGSQIGIRQAIGLLSVFAKALNKPKLILEPFAKCTYFLQKNCGSSDVVPLLSRSILITSYCLADCPAIAKFDQALGTDTKAMLLASFFKVLDQAPLVDIVLEGISALWLKFPETITAKEGDRHILEAVLSKIESKGVTTKTKCLVLFTLSEFLHQFSLSAAEHDGVAMMKLLEAQLTEFLIYLEVEDMELRYHSCLLYSKMFRRGMISLSSAVQAFVKMLADSSPAIVKLAKIELQGAAKNRIALVQQAVSAPSELVESLFVYQQHIGFSYPSGLARKIQQTKKQKKVEIELDSGFLDPVPIILKGENAQMQASVLSGFLKFFCKTETLIEVEVDDEDEEAQTALSKIRFCGELLFFGQRLISDSKKATAAIDLLEGTIKTNETLIYTRFKKQLAEDENGSLALITQKSLKLFVMKTLLVQLKKQLGKKVEDSKQAPASKLLKYALQSKLAVNSLFTSFEDLSDFAHELKVQLRNLIKSKEDSLKQRFRAQLEKSRDIALKYQTRPSEVEEEDSEDSSKPVSRSSNSRRQKKKRSQPGRSMSRATDSKESERPSTTNSPFTRRKRRKQTLLHN